MQVNLVRAPIGVIVDYFGNETVCDGRIHCHVPEVR